MRRSIRVMTSPVTEVRATSTLKLCKASFYAATWIFTAAISMISGETAAAVPPSTLLVS